MQKTTKLLILCVCLCLCACKKKTEKPSTTVKSITVSTFAGSGMTGIVDGSSNQANFGYMSDLAVDAIGNVYVVDYNLRKITPQGGVTTVLDNRGYPTSGTYSGIAVDNNGNIFTGYAHNLEITKISPTGYGTLFAGTPGAYTYGGQSTGLEFDMSGNLFCIGRAGLKIYKINSSGVITTFAGTDVSGFINGSATNAEFAGLTDIAISSNGTIYVSDTFNQVIRKITTSGIVSTFAGNGKTGFVNGSAGDAEFNFPTGIVADGLGNVYVSDFLNNVIRKITPDGNVSTFAGNGKAGLINGAATDASFSNPFGLAIDATGNLYVSDRSNYVIRKIIQN